MKALPFAASLFVLLIAATAGGEPGRSGEDQPDLRALFPREAEVSVDGPGLARLNLPAEVLAACRADLSDLRLFDEQGEEIPFAVDSGFPPADARLAATRRLPVEVRDVFRDEERSEEAPTLYREEYELQIPEEPPLDSRWSLVFEPRRTRFISAVHVDFAGRDGTWQRAAAGSIFRIENVWEGKDRIDLPDLPAGTVLRVVIEGNDGYLAPRMHLESTRILETVPRARVLLEEISREREEGFTVLTVARPRGLVPDVLQFETRTAAFDRPVEVWDVGPTSTDAWVGRGRVYRVPAGANSEEVEVPVRAARGDRLRIRIADGDSPPLAGLAVHAVVRRPSLIFSVERVSRSTGTWGGVLAFGGGRAHRPVYDLAGLLPRTGIEVRDERARAVLSFYGRKDVRRARLGEIRPNPRYRDEPLLGFAMRAGAEADPRVYSHRRELKVKDSPEGLSRLRLKPEDAAVLRADFADLRVVDGTGRQRPYLLERDAGVDWTEVPLDGPLRDGELSRYRLDLPASPLLADVVSLDTPAPFFDRSYRLEAIIAGAPSKAPVVIASGRLERRPGDPRPVSISFPPRRVESMELIVVDGDDAPLSLEARVRAPLSDLFVVAPPGEYALLLGYPEAESPRYEIARVRDVVLAVESASIEAESLQPNRAYSRTARLSRGEGPIEIALWASLILAVLVLGYFTVRLARQEEPEPPADPAKPAADESGTSGDRT